MSKQRRTTKQQPPTLWCVDTKDGHSFCVPGRLEVTRQRTALIYCDSDGKRHLMFGALAGRIKSIEVIEE
jgi:hypothetical protein